MHGTCPRLKSLLQIHYEYGPEGEHLLAYADVHSIYKLPGTPRLMLFQSSLLWCAVLACKVWLCLKTDAAENCCKSCTAQ